MRRDKSWHRRQALQVASMLPNDADDALAILEIARQIVQEFWKIKDRPKDRKPNVITLIPKEPA
jgi:hypothetical protein